MDLGFLGKVLYVFFRKQNNVTPTYYFTKQHTKYCGDCSIFPLKMVDFKILLLLKTTKYFLKVYHLHAKRFLEEASSLISHCKVEIEKVIQLLVLGAISTSQIEHSYKIAFESHCHFSFTVYFFTVNSKTLHKSIICYETFRFLKMFSQYIYRLRKQQRKTAN